MVLCNPATAVLVVSLMAIGLLLIRLTAFDTGEEYESYSDQIVSTDSQVAFGDTRSGATVAVIGTIQNRSPVPWKGIHFHVDFFDAQGSRTDVGEREEYAVRLPSNSSTSFKVSFRREFPQTNYVKHTVRVISAKDARAKW